MFLERIAIALRLIRSVPHALQGKVSVKKIGDKPAIPKTADRIWLYPPCHPQSAMDIGLCDGVMVVSCRACRKDIAVLRHDKIHRVMPYLPYERTIN
jgi:hypothetical protein